jgi:hypothetical protein
MAKYATAGDALQNYDDNDDDGHQSPDDSEPPAKDVDYVPITAAAANDVSFLGIKKVAGVHSPLVEKHREIFMACAFPPNQDNEGDEMLLCHPQSELDYIAHVVTNWQAGIQVKRWRRDRSEIGLLNSASRIQRATNARISFMLRRSLFLALIVLVR